MKNKYPPNNQDGEHLFAHQIPQSSDDTSQITAPQQIELSISRLIRNRLAELGLLQIPPSAVAFLSQKLALQARNQAARSLTPRSVARAILATTPPATSTSTLNNEVVLEPKPQGLGEKCSPSFDIEIPF